VISDLRFGISDFGAATGTGGFIFFAGMEMVVSVLEIGAAGIFSIGDWKFEI
jgi:hypothetical protein